MNPITRICTVDTDGNVVVPVGIDHAGDKVEVTVAEPQTPAPTRQMSPEEWHAFIAEVAGSIDDPTFVRPEQGDFEERMALTMRTTH